MVPMPGLTSGLSNIKSGHFDSDEDHYVAQRLHQVHEHSLMPNIRALDAPDRTSELILQGAA